VLAHAAGLRTPDALGGGRLPVADPALPQLSRQAGLLLAMVSPAHAATLLPPRTAIDDALALPPGQALAGLGGRDVQVLMLESYGAVVYDEPRAVAALAPRRAELAAAITAGGRQVVSAFVRSPTFGGASDLAHLGLLAAMDLSDPAAHDVLLTTQRPTLTRLFAREGWQSHGVYPAVRWAWPERVFYGYDVYLDGPALGWQGPSITAWHIPDQAAYALYTQGWPRDAKAPPRLSFFATISTHMPFKPAPPVQPDVARLLGPQPYEAADVARLQAEWPDWLDLFPDYVRAFDYTYRWLTLHFARPEPRESLTLILGDHQPVAAVTGRSSSWDVPVHVVVRDPALLQRFIALGFAPGLEPPRTAIGPLHGLAGRLLCATAAPAAQPVLCAAWPALVQPAAAAPQTR
jgi:hypothetical protein